MFDFIFVDLDDTIFDTRRFKADIFGVLSDFGVKEKDFNLAYKNAAELPKFGYYDYTFERQLEALREMGYTLGNEITIQLNDLFNINYKKVGAEDFLKSLQCIGKKIILLTAGNHFFQDKKIKNINLTTYFDRVEIIDGGKDDIVGEAVKKGKVLFINDNLEENKMIKENFLEAKVLSIMNETYWTEEEYKKEKLDYFESLEEIKKYLEKSNAMSCKEF
ncbi:MAG TPA: HAD family hydrolase [Candidatus Magasanikbacteria bacterium]|nr:HAD family hydrolase [Candidatus Magasanikbacteria bacterium]